MTSHMRQRRRVLIAGAVLLLAQACTDTQARYDAFLERTADLRGVDAGGLLPGDRFDWSGHYLLALSTVLGPDTPLLFAVDADVASDLSSVSLQLQALTTDADDEPRTAIGDSFGIEDVAYEEDGSFSADLGVVTVPGRANPVTGSDITASVQLIASTRASDSGVADVFCGQVTGMVTVPLPFDLAGSTFGAVLTDDAIDAEPLLRCPQEP